MIAKGKLKIIWLNTKKYYRRVKENHVTVGVCSLIIVASAVYIFECIDNKEFDAKGLLTETYGFLWDILLFGILVVIVDNWRTKKERFIRYAEELADYKDWNQEEGIYRKAGIIKRFSLSKEKLPPLHYFYLEGVNLRGLELKEVDLFRSKLNRAILSDTDFNKAFLRASEFNEADITYATLNGADFGGSDLVGAKLNNSRLIETDFSASNLKNAKLFNSDLSKAKFIDAILAGAEFTQSKVVNAQFNGANLRAAIFLQTNLSGANLKKTDLRDVDFCHADLRGVELGGAKGYTASQISHAKTLYGVKNLDPEIEKELRENGKSDLLDKEPEE